MFIFKSINIDSSTAGNVLANNQINRYFINNSYRRNEKLMRYINMTKDGSIIFTTGSGRYKLLLVAGVHGNELASQSALIKLMKNIINQDIKPKCQLHIIPFLIPYTTMTNSRKYDGVDMNRHAHKDGITKKIVDYAQKNQITALCDCHSTDPNNKPGFASVFCSVKPLIDSSKIAAKICLDTKSQILPIHEAGMVLKGAVEDESNIRGIPAVTIETVCENGKVNDGAVNFSYNQIISFLDYFGVI